MRTVATAAVVLPVFFVLGSLRRLLTGLAPWAGGAIALVVTSAWVLVLATVMGAGDHPPALTIAAVACGAIVLAVTHQTRRRRGEGRS
ncbi:MAG: hypothetical protein M3011_00415 [Actinomycetota bacterium]|nr:hypothetical protein [Actinomycetota bacterium]